ncbi:hypothetical protein BZG36_02126 [Bifiguratus adelaidae]|uniref:Isochorismatase-like domain-containing protein n=1 Tax=Bifiguratus adelaidae TaxID=1938954 RepID=A0A261Y318_9FUNG|nr:hypothetical protein BZG36_02126 [Bifiguratus adelaidae]
MLTTTDAQELRRFGPPGNQWVLTPTHYDLTRDTIPSLFLKTTSASIKIAPSLSALLVIDMQNFFLSPRLGRTPKAGLVDSVAKAVDHARKLGMHVIWVNWGLTEQEVAAGGLPATVERSFAREDGGQGGFGWDLGDGMGRLLMRNTWNAQLIDGLEQLPHEQWVHKNRTSGFWGTDGGLKQLLDSMGVRTCFFAGVNADQCVMGTLQDAHCIGFDCVLLGDCTATTSPTGALETVLYNVGRSYGFVVDCTDFVNATIE